MDAGQTVVVGAGGQGGTAAPAAALSAAAVACESPYRAGDGRTYRCDLARGHRGPHQWGGTEVWLSWEDRCVCRWCGAQLRGGRCPACMERWDA